MPRKRPGISFGRLALVQVAVAGVVAAAYAGMSAPAKDSLREVVLKADVTETVPIPRTKPLSAEPLYDDPTVVTDEELAGVLRQLQPKFPREKLKPNFIEHALRTWSIRAKFQDPKAMSGAEMLDFLVNNGAYKKSWGDEKGPLLIDKPHGISIRTGTDPNESVHHDHWLASLTEAGVSLDEPVFSPGRPQGTIADVLQEALRDFRADERETEWSVMSFGYWIAPQKEWRTSSGRVLSFDVLARRLIRGDKRLGVCNGTHRVYSLAVLLRLDDEYHLVSPEVRTEIWTHLESIRDLIKVAQFDDGHWPTNWSKGADAVANPIDDENYRKVINTGHHLEWLAIAPKELHPPHEQIVRAAKWVIRDTLTKSESEIIERFTFYSHVANALSLWRKTHPADFWMAWEPEHASDPLPPPPELPGKGADPQPDLPPPPAPDAGAKEAAKKDEKPAAAEVSPASQPVLQVP